MNSQSLPQPRIITNHRVYNLTPPARLALPAGYDLQIRYDASNGRFRISYNPGQPPTGNDWPGWLDAVRAWCDEIKPALLQRLGPADA